MKYLISRGVAPPLGPPLFLRRNAVASLLWSVLCISVGLSKFGSQSLHFPHFYEAGPPRNASSDFQIFRSVVLAVGKQCFIAIGVHTDKEAVISCPCLHGKTKREDSRVEMGTSPAFIQTSNTKTQRIHTYLNLQHSNNQALEPTLCCP